MVGSRWTSRRLLNVVHPFSTKAGLNLRQWRKPFAASSTLAIVAVAVVTNLLAWRGYDIGPWLGVDFHLFREFGQRWLETGSMYLPAQFAGPYSVWWSSSFDPATTPAIYPPPMGPVFGVLALLPLPVAVVAWWGIPAAVLGWALVRWRPAPWTWPLLALPWVHPQYGIVVITGNTNLWAMALVALGLVYRWPAALVLVKPTLAPFALVGVRDRRWWLVAAVIGIWTVAGGYLTVIANGTDSGGFLYSLPVYPLLLLPVVAWLGRDHDRRVLGAVVVPLGHDERQDRPGGRGPGDAVLRG